MSINLMNDTLDNFTFSDINNDLLTGLSRNTELSILEKGNTIRNESVITISQSTEVNKSEISFNDSLFLSNVEFSQIADDLLKQEEENGTKIQCANSEERDIKHKFSEVEIGAESKVSSVDKSFEDDKISQDEKNAQSNLISYLKNDTSSANYILENDESQIDKNIYRLSEWGLPESVLEKYESRNIITMFAWQVECLRKSGVLEENRNLVYSAPTSAGKTLVAEILMIKTVLEREKKVIFILPFVSVVREKMFYFQDILSSSGVRVEGFMGSYNPPGGFQSVQVAICTIEKANSLVNKLLQEGTLSDIGAVVIDEMHLLGDPSRGYLLELLLTKLRYISVLDNNVSIQIIGMSATLPNLQLLAKWLDAELYITTFRPIPLYERAKVCGEIYNNELKLIRRLEPLPELDTDTDNILQLCLETIQESCSVLIFCPTKNWCENLSQQIAVAFWKIGSSKTKISQSLREQLKSDLIKELLEQLKYCPVGLDQILHKTVSFGVAFHHAGLTMDERDIIEGAFRNGVIRVLVATSTLSSGVNLPARRVIIRTPIFHGKPLDALTYRQMIGRAGRMGKDTAGESILVCQKNEYNIAKTLMSAQLEPIESCLEGAGRLKRAILEIVASGVASSPDDVKLFTSCTLLAQDDPLDNPIDEAVEFLVTNEFIRLQGQEDGSSKYIATSLGKACLSSSIPPEDGLALFAELEKARRCFVLETELHLIYLVTPYSACHQWSNLDWMFYLDLWEKLPLSMKRVGELVGVQESYIVNATRGKIQTNTSKLYHKLLVHKRFFIALALQDLVNEKPLSEVSAKFNCNRGMLQSLQLTASTFAGMVTAFSKQLGWTSVEILISQFQDRLQFGVSRDLLDLMRLPILNGKCARALFNGGLDTLVQLANSDVSTIENILHKVMPFESSKVRDGETEYDLKERKKFKNIWITGKEGLTEREAAELLLLGARKYLQIELKLKEAKWDQSFDKKTTDSSKLSQQSEADKSDDLKTNEYSCSLNVSSTPKCKSSVNLSFCPSNLENEECHPSSSLNLENINEVNALNDSCTSLFSSHSEQNDYNLPERSRISSDRSLFEDSFTLSETNINQQTKVKDVFASNSCFSNNTATSLNSSGDLITTSQDENCLLVEERVSLVMSSKKRSRGGKENDTFLVGLQSPRKKKKTSKLPKTALHLPLKNNHCLNKVNGTGEQLTKIEIVDVCCDERLFEVFCNEVKQERVIALTLACIEVSETKPVIGIDSINVNDKKSFTYKNRKVEGFAITWGGSTVYYLSLEKFKKCVDLIRLITSNKEITIKMFDSKEHIKVLKRCCAIDFRANIEDPKIGDWILQPEGKEKNLQAMTVTYFSKAVDLLKLCGTTKGVGSVALDLYSTAESKIRSCTESLITWYLVNSIKDELHHQNPQLVNVYATEMACLRSVANMEASGIAINKAVLRNLTDTLNEQLTVIEKKAFSWAGRRFSFTSSTDVAKVLGMFKGKRVSTRKQVLEQNDHPISELVLQWRKLNCTITKMIQPLIRAVENGRIYGCCIVHTSTGRISMQEPNLQNVAKNFEIVNCVTGEKVSISCRNAFVASQDCILLSADYCQLELRLLAHLSQDGLLCKIMRQEGDVFRSIAAKWNNITENEVTDNLRQHAKQLCYGIIYGMGSKSLSEHLNIDEKEATSLMETFRNTYPGVKNYVKKVIQNCQNKGFVETISGRRRYLPQINSKGAALKSQAERQAVNTTIQGSAADVVKQAMVALEENFFPCENPPKLVLHLHDELIYEVSAKKLDEYALILKRTMEESVKLSIPLPVKVKYGTSWGQMTELNM